MTNTVGVLRDVILGPRPKVCQIADAVSYARRVRWAQ